jgi:outer membrane protein
MKQPLSLIAIAIGSIALAIGIAAYVKNGKQAAFVNTADVFARFEMTKEYKQSFENISNVRKHLLDSMELNLKLMAGKLNAGARKGTNEIKQFEYLRQEYLQKKQQLDEDNQALSEKYDQEIWTRLNQYAKDFGHDRGYTFLYGANGDGTIMFADEKLDVTEAFTTYINQQYQGAK